MNAALPKKFEKRMYLAAFFVPFVGLFALAALAGVRPFGTEYEFLTNDLYFQYNFFSKELVRLIEDGIGPYSWYQGLGGAVWPWFCYYVIDPWNLLFGILPYGGLQDVVFMISIFGRVALFSVTICFYLRSHHRDLSAVFPALGGISIGLGSFMVMFMIHIIWLDSLIFSPLILYFLERVLSGEDRWAGPKYAALLFISTMMNYYITLVFCMFISVYAVFWLIEKAFPVRQTAKAFARFAGWSILGGLCAAFVWLPALVSIQGTHGPSGLDDILSSFSAFSDPQAVTVMFQFGLDPVYAQTNWPHFYVGSFFLLLFAGYFFCKGIPRRRRVCRAFFSLVVFSGVVWMPAVIVWHGLHRPQGVYGRHLIFFLIVAMDMILEALPHFLKLKGLRFIIPVSFIFGVFLMCFFLPRAVMDTGAALLGLIFLCVYLLLIKIYTLGDGVMRFVNAAAVVVVVIDVFLNAHFSAFCYHRLDEWVNDVVYSGLSSEDLSNDDVFYRAAVAPRIAQNALLGLGIPSCSFYGSNMQFSASAASYVLGGQYYENNYMIVPVSSLQLGLLGVRYVVVDENISFPYEQTASFDRGVRVLEVPNTLQFGCMLPDFGVDKADGDNGLFANVIADAVVSGSVAAEHIGDFKAEGLGRGSFTIEEDGFYSLYIAGKNSITSVDVLVNGEEAASVNNYFTFVPVSLGLLQKGDVVSFGQSDRIEHRMDSDGVIAAALYLEHDDVQQQVLQKLAEHAFELETIDSYGFSGSIAADEAGTLMLPVPVEKGWTAYVDGKEAPIVTVLGGLCGLELEAGRHDVVFKFHTVGLVPGVAVSVSSLAVLILVCFLKRRAALRKA